MNLRAGRRAALSEERAIDPAAAREAALKLLERTRCTRLDLLRRLKGKGFDPAVTAQVLDRLAGVGLIDGAGYARAHAYDNLEKFAIDIESLLAASGPVFVAMKVVPEVQNEPIGKRKRWLTRSREQVIKDLRRELGIADA